VAPTISWGDLAEEKWSIMSPWNFSMKSTQEGQQVVMRGRAPLPWANRWTNSAASSKMVKSAPKFVSNTAANPMRRSAV
jgi:hypothetical protein